ncbi:MAG TPA: AraC family transcriptional regulator [Streptosporangiaceae bacterium]
MTGRAVWRRACPAGQALDLLHARVAEPYAPHVHEEYAVGACTAGREVIRYRGTLHYAGPGSVVVLEPGEAHTGGPADPPDFTYRVMYPAAGLLAEGRLAQGVRRMPRFREPVIADPGLAAELRRLHAALGAGLLESEPLEAESRLSWLLGELVRRHASPSRDVEVPGAGRVARLVMAQLADRLVSPPALAEIAAGTGLSRYQLIRSFRTEVGMPPYAWLAQHRVSAARALLERGCRPAEAAAMTGFADQAHLTRWFRRVVGVTPGVYRNSVQDRTPRYR